MIPETYGGSGLNLQAAAVILEEIDRNGCNAAACHAPMYTMGTVLRHGSDGQKQACLPGIANGSLRLQALGVTEPTPGTGTLALKTTARRDGDSYVIGGQKVWAFRAGHSDLMVLPAHTTPREQAVSRTDGLSVFLIDLRAVEGVTVRPIRAMINQGAQFPLARAQAHMMAAGAMVYRAAAMYDSGLNPGVEANAAKMLAADASCEVAEACLQTDGGFGIAEEYDVERKFREARLYQVAPISTNLILCYIAEQVLGLPKSCGEGRR